MIHWKQKAMELSEFDLEYRNPDCFVFVPSHGAPAAPDYDRTLDALGQ